MLPRDPQRFTWRNFFIWLDRLHKFAEHFAQHKIHPFRKRALKKAEEWMIERFEGSDGLAAIFPGMLNSLIALQGAGLSGRPSAGPPMRAGIEKARARNRARRPHRAVPFAGLGHRHRRHCLHESGLSSDHPALVKALRLAHGPRSPLPRRLALQEPHGRRAERLGL